ncbi:hypothetical protein AB0N64_05010 [Microbacterium sp. NPDC089318]
MAVFEARHRDDNLTVTPVQHWTGPSPLLAATTDREASSLLIRSETRATRSWSSEEFLGLPPEEISTESHHATKWFTVEAASWGCPWAPSSPTSTPATTS